MALHGFESNDDYDYPVACLFDNEFPGLRCLNVVGHKGRRKTAFAWALAQALEMPHIIYHDFSESSPPPPDVILPPSKDESGKEEPPIAQLDSRLADACGYSEAEDAILILDQLQVADFREHIRIYRFLMSGEWDLRGATHQASKRHLSVFLISDDPLYHSLQKISFRLWVNSASSQQVAYLPQDFGLSEDALELMESLRRVFVALEIGPTRSEYERILRDIVHRVRDMEALRCTLFGWTESVLRDALYDMELEGLLQEVIDHLYRYLGCTEVELEALEL